MTCSTFPRLSIPLHGDLRYSFSLGLPSTLRPLTVFSQGNLPPLDLAELQAEFDRYDGLFAEVQKQAEVHSGKLSKLFGKLWAGTGNLLKDLFAMNRKLSSEKAELLREQKRSDQKASETKNAYITELEHSKLENLIARASLRDKVGSALPP